MIDERWQTITDTINALASGKAALTVEQVQRKWSDFKSDSRTAKINFQKSQNLTGGGSNKVKDPTELQWKVTNFLGKTATDGVAGAELLDTSQLAIEPVTPILAIQPTDIVQQAISGAGIPPSTPTTSGENFINCRKRRKTPKEQQIEQTEQLLQTEDKILTGISEIRDELRNLNTGIGGLQNELKSMNIMIYSVFIEFKRLNDRKEGLLQPTDGQSPANADTVNRFFNL